MKDISLASSRTDFQLTLPDGRIFKAPVGTNLEEVFQVAYPDEPKRYLAALVDNELHTLRFTPWRDYNVVPLTRKDDLGRLIHNRSAVLVMLAAFKEILPDVQIFVEYRMPMDGLFCRANRKLAVVELARVEACAKKIIAEDWPITFEEKTVEEAEKILAENKEPDKINLLRYCSRKTGKAWLVSLGKVTEFFHDVLVSSAGYISTFALRPCPSGFILISSRQDVQRAEVLRDTGSVVDAAFRRATDLAHQLSVDTVSKLNVIAGGRNSGEVREGVLVAEAAQSGSIDTIAELIAIRETVRLVLIAGPSSSGKTTFSKRLAISLQTQGIKPVTLEMDRYFVERSQTPRDEKGEYDFENIRTLDLDLLQHDLDLLMNGEEVTLPSFNFTDGTRGVGPKLRLLKDQIIIAEGIHGLNPLLTGTLPSEKIFRVYISPLTPLNIDRHNNISTRDTRMLRRIVRDARTRGQSAEATILRWPSIQDGEYRNIFPYQNSCDAMFNSHLLYEIAALKTYAEPLLLQIPRHSPAYPKARNLLHLLSFFEAMQDNFVPENSLLREFIGGSVLERYLPGQFESYWSVSSD